MTTIADQAGGARAGDRLVPPIWRLVVDRASPITSLNAQCAGIPFYCVHPIAGDVTSFQALACHLEGAVSIFGIHAPREMTNAMFANSVTNMAKYYVSSLLKFQPEGPVILGGWSAGAIVALEMAQQLRARGRVVPLLVALDGAPCNTGAKTDLWNPLCVWKALRNVPFWLWEELRQAETWSHLIHNMFAKVDFLLRCPFPTIRNDQTLQGDVVRKLLFSREWSESQIAFIAAFYEAVRRYQPQLYDGRVVVIESRTQPLLNLLQIGAAWKQINPSVEILQLKCNHVGFFREPTLTKLAGLIRERLSAREHASSLRAAAKGNKSSSGSASNLDVGPGPPEAHTGEHTQLAG